MRLPSRSTFAGLSPAAFLGLSLFTSTVSAAELSCASCQQTPATPSTPVAPTLPPGQTYETTPTGGRLLDDGVVVGTVTNDAEDRASQFLVRNERTDMSYDNLGRVSQIVHSVNGLPNAVTLATYNVDGSFRSLVTDDFVHDAVPYNLQIRQIQQQRPQRPKPRPVLPGKPIDYCNLVFSNCNNGCAIAHASVRAGATAAYLAAHYACKLNFRCQTLAYGAYSSAMAAAHYTAQNCIGKCQLDHEVCLNGY